MVSFIFLLLDKIKKLSCFCFVFFFIFSSPLFRIPQGQCFMNSPGPAEHDELTTNQVSALISRGMFLFHWLHSENGINTTVGP